MLTPQWLRQSPAWPSVVLLCVALFAGTARTARAQAGKVKVEIEGISGELADNVHAVLQIEREGKQPLSPDRVQRLNGKADADIDTALEPFGYYHARISKSLRRDGDNWIARYRIDPGPVVRVGAVDISLTGEGATRPAFRALVDSYPLKRGDTLLQLHYETAKLGFLTLASDSGYLKAAFDTASILLDRTADTARILIGFNTGPRGTFGPVHFHEERNIIDTSVLAKRIPFKQGAPFRHDKLLDLQTSLSEDPYWARVEVTPQPDSMQGHEVPIDVDLIPTHQRTTEYGIGYGTDTGPRGHIQNTWHWLNRKGHNADIVLNVGSIQQSIQGTYRIPAFGSPTGILTFDGGYERDHPKTSLSHVGKVRASLLRKRLGWQETLSLTYQHETYGVGVDSGTSKLLIPGGSWTRVVTDSKIFPSHGYKAQVDVQGSLHNVLADASFLELHAQLKRIWSYTPRARLLVRGQLGHIFTSNFRNLPPTLRFFTGGDQTVRGFAYESLGELDDKGNVIGGPNLVVASVESDYRVFSKYGVAVFTDVGNALGHIRASALEQGVGAGLRWISPVGLVRLDGAFAVSRPGAPFRIHLSIGTYL